MFSYDSNVDNFYYRVTYTKLYWNKLSQPDKEQNTDKYRSTKWISE